MELKDTELAREALLPEGWFSSIRENDGQLRIGGSMNSEFIENITGSQEKLLERMWDPQVFIHGRIAMVWAPYDFHRNGEFSHCGVDLFSLFKTDDGWKITSTAYTVETAGCAESPLGPIEKDQSESKE
ncbi:nuclear transport factor 2 family protein [candidate division KSB1 bacterium]